MVFEFHICNNYSAGNWSNIRYFRICMAKIKFIINKIETYVNDQNKKRKEKIQLEFIDEKAQYNGGDLKYKFHIDRDSIFQKMF